MSSSGIKCFEEANTYELFIVELASSNINLGRKRIRPVRHILLNILPVIEQASALPAEHSSAHKNCAIYIRKFVA